jgi:CoA:oxalate CoA-transferase
MTESPPAGPLAGLKVLDMSRFVAGPFCTMMLGDLGADVIKVEKPEGGDDVRRAPPMVEGDSLFILVFNRNKRSITIDMKTERGQALLKELAAEADVLVENFRPGVMERFGCAWDDLIQINDRLIMARISGFGQDGPHATRPSFDAIAQAASGIMDMTGAADGPPTMAGTTVIDHSTGLHAAVAILAALQARQTTGRGQLIDVALLDSAVSLLMTAIPAYSLLGITNDRMGNRDRYGAPSNTFPTSDGRYVHLMAGGDERFKRFLDKVGKSELAADPRFATGPDRLDHVEELEAVVMEWTMSTTADAIVEAMAEARVPCGKIADIAEVIDNPQLRHRGQIVEVEHPTAGKIPMQGTVPKMSDTPASIRRPAPSAGQHNGEILSDWLGYDEAAIQSLGETGII